MDVVRWGRLFEYRAMAKWSIDRDVGEQHSKTPSGEKMERRAEFDACKNVEYEIKSFLRNFLIILRSKYIPLHIHGNEKKKKEFQRWKRNWNLRLIGKKFERRENFTLQNDRFSHWWMDERVHIIDVNEAD